METHTGTNSGFTLLEVLVAATVFTFLMLTLFTAFQTFMATGQVLTQHAGMMQKSQPCFSWMARDLEALAVMPYPRYEPPEPGSDPDVWRFVAQEMPDGDQVFSRLRFASLNHVNLGPDRRKGVEVITYYVRPDNHGGYDLCRNDCLDNRTADAMMADGCTDPVLIRQITEFECRFVDIQGNAYRYWDSDSAEFEYGMPHSVQIRLRFQVNGRSCTQRATVILPVRRGTGS